MNLFLSTSLFNKYKPDLIHETYYSLQAVKSRNAIRIITLYDMIHEIFPHLFPRTDKTSANKKRSLQRADYIIAISNKTKSDLIRLLGVDPIKISVVRLGFTPYRKLIPVCKFRKPILHYIGFRKGYKNFEILERIFGKNHYLCKN